MRDCTTGRFPDNATIASPARPAAARMARHLSVAAAVLCTLGLAGCNWDAPWNSASDGKKQQQRITPTSDRLDYVDPKAKPVDTASAVPRPELRGVGRTPSSHGPSATWPAQTWDVVTTTADGQSDHWPVPEPVLLHSARLANPTRDPLRSESPALPWRERVGPLENFTAALRALDTGTRTRPVTVLHMGDSHIASDTFPNGLRKRFQKRFGDAGRGYMQPPKAFKWHRIAGMDMQASEGWTFANSLTERSGPYGLSGVRATTSQPGETLGVTADGQQFDRARVRFLRAPGGGQFRLTLGERSIVVETSGAKSDVVGHAEISAQGGRLELETLGDGNVVILGWSLEKARPGIQYVNLGIPGAAAYIARAWSPGIMSEGVRDLAPELIVFGYGSNEAFNTSLTAKSYERHVRRLIGNLMRAAPNASLLILGPPDGASRKADGPSCGSGWKSLSRLALVQSVLRDVANDLGAAYWDWADYMGGRCSVMRWAARSDPLASKDRLHLTGAGYDRSADALFGYLLESYERSLKIAGGVSQ